MKHPADCELRSLWTALNGNPTIKWNICLWNDLKFPTLTLRLAHTWKPAIKDISAFVRKSLIIPTPSTALRYVGQRIPFHFKKVKQSNAREMIWISSSGEVWVNTGYKYRSYSCSRRKQILLCLHLLCTWHIGEKKENAYRGAAVYFVYRRLLATGDCQQIVTETCAYIPNECQLLFSDLSRRLPSV